MHDIDMKASLKLILEKTGYGNNLGPSSENFSNKYGQILLYDKGDMPLEETVYVCGEMPEEKFLRNESLGLILVNTAEEDQDEILCEYVHINGLSLSEVLNLTLKAFGKIQDQLRGLMQRIGERASIQELIEEIYPIFHNPAYLVDATFKVLAIDRRFDMRNLSATWKRLEDEGYLPLDLISKLMESGELNRIENSTSAYIVTSEYFYTRFINCNLRYKGRIQGHLFIVEMFKTFTPGDVETADTVCQMTMDGFMADEDMQRKRGHFYESFMKDLFEGKPLERSKIKSQLRYLDLKDGSVYMVGKILTPPEESIEERLTSQLERLTDVRAARYEGHIMGLFQLKGKEKIPDLKKKLRSISVSWNCAIALSDPFTDIYKTAVYASQAARILELNPETGKSALYDYSSFALKDLMDEPAEKLKRFCPPEIEKMADYDRKHQSFCCETLLCYLEKERSMSETAAALNIHRNTLAYRLERIKELFSPDLDDPDARLRLYLGLKIQISGRKEE